MKKRYFTPELSIEIINDCDIIARGSDWGGGGGGEWNDNNEVDTSDDS